MKKMKLEQLEVKSFSIGDLEGQQVIGGCSINLTHNPVGCYASCPILSEQDCGCFMVRGHDVIPQ